MSLIDFQAGIAQLIRLPRENRNLPMLLSSLNLTEQERQSVIELSEDLELNKYGNELANQRWDRIDRKIELLYPFMDKEWLESIWFEQFEPQAVAVASDMAQGEAFTLAYLEFLLHGLEHQFASFGLPEYCKDLVRYVRAESLVRRPVRPHRLLPENSRLLHDRFEVLTLEFDILKIAQEYYGLERDLRAEHHFVPERRPVTALMLLDLSGAFRIYEIEASLGSFLEQESVGTAAWLPRSDTLSLLSSLGLVKSSEEV